MLSNSKRGIAVDENGKLDDEVSVISSIQTPEDAGGGTLWASGYEAFDRLSTSWKRFAETLSATHYQVALFLYLPKSKLLIFDANEMLFQLNFNKVAREHGLELLENNRGAPEISGHDFTASQSLIVV